MRHTLPVSQGCRKELPCVKEDKKGSGKTTGTTMAPKFSSHLQCALRLRLGAPDGIMPLLSVTGLEVAE